MATEATPWQIPAPPMPALGAKGVHVWRASLRQPPAVVEAFLGTLAPDEEARARRFRHEKDRQAYIVARGLLRLLLAHYLRRTAGEIRFSVNPYGKPALDPPPGEAPLQFNLSHSADLVLLAVADGREVGVDVERVRTMSDLEGLAERYFAEREYRELCALPDVHRQAAFFNCWSRKEAFIKALGKGLAFPLDQFEVSFGPGEPARLRWTLDPALAGRWSLHALPVDPGYAAALVVEGTDWHLRCFSWEPPVAG